MQFIKALELGEFIHGVGNHLGHVKMWKAIGMARTILDMQKITDDFNGERLQKYVRNCLEMEGFQPAACDALAGMIERWVKK